MEEQIRCCQEGFRNVSSKPPPSSDVSRAEAAQTPRRPKAFHKSGQPGHDEHAHEPFPPRASHCLSHS